MQDFENEMRDLVTEWATAYNSDASSSAASTQQLDALGTRTVLESR